MVDYRKLIDEETWDFIRRTEEWYPPDTAEQDINERRLRYDAMCRDFFNGYPDGVSAEDLDADGVPVRTYSRTNRQGGVTVLYGHGGSLMVGGLDSHDDVCAEICEATGFNVIAVDYRLCPEFTRNDALDDFQTSLDWARKTLGGNIICAGDSAGGFLSASIVHANRKVGDIAGQVLIYPGLPLSLESGSIHKHAFAPLLTRDEVLEYRELLQTGLLPGPDRHLQTLNKADLSDLPITVAISAECDPVADDAREYAKAINSAGGCAIWFEDKSLVHGHLRARHSVKRARESFDRVLRAVKLIGSGVPVSRGDFES